MKEKLFKLLFKKEAKNLERYKDLWLKCERNLNLERLKSLEASKIKPSMADLMRDSLGLPMINFANTDKDGYPPHYLEGLKPDERAVFVAELNNIYQKPEFHAVLEYWINAFGNHSIRKGKDEVDPGRYSINGVAMIRKSLESAHQEILDAQKPDEKFDIHAVLPEGDD